MKSRKLSEPELSSNVMFHLNSNCNKIIKSSDPFPANIYLFKVSNRNIGKRSEICPK